MLWGRPHGSVKRWSSSGFHNVIQAVNSNDAADEACRHVLGWDPYRYRHHAEAQERLPHTSHRHMCRSELTEGC